VKFKIDENLPVEIAELLKDAQHDAMMVVEQGLKGQDDRRVIDVCLHEQRVLVTLDLDFADVRAYPPRDYSGIIVLRVRRQDKPHVLSVFGNVLPLLMQEQVEQRLWIVEETRVRVRGEEAS
jgi:predicted nuclease of predicted toxin-antitoxin system